VRIEASGTGTSRQANGITLPRDTTTQESRPIKRARPPGKSTTNPLDKPRPPHRRPSIGNMLNLIYKAMTMKEIKKAA